MLCTEGFREVMLECEEHNNNRTNHHTEPAAEGSAVGFGVGSVDVFSFSFSSVLVARGNVFRETKVTWTSISQSQTFRQKKSSGHCPHSSPPGQRKT